MRHPFGQFVLSVPVVSPPKLLPGPSLVAIVWEFGKDSLDTVGVLLSNTQNVINTLPTTSKSKALHGLLWGKLPSSQTNPIWSLVLIPHHLQNAQVPHNFIHLHIFWPSNCRFLIPEIPSYKFLSIILHPYTIFIIYRFWLTTLCLNRES